MNNKKKSQPQRSVLVKTVGSLEERTVSVPHQSKARDEVADTTNMHQLSELAVEAVSEMQGTGLQQSDGGVKRSKASAQEITTVTEFIEALYTGKIKTLPEATVRRITNCYVPLQSDQIGGLLTQVQSLDVSLEKTRLLMSLSGRAAPNRTFSKALRDFARDAVINHPVMRGEPEGACPFYGTSDVQPLEDFWKALYREQGENVSGFPKTEDGPSDGVESQQKEESKLSQQLRKARRNAFFCALLWRYGEGLIGLSEVLRLLKATVFQQTSSTSSLETRLVEGLAQIQEAREIERLALVFEWFAGQSRIEANRVIEAQSANERLNTQLAEAIQALEIGSSSLLESQNEVAELRGALSTAERQLEIERTHSRADHEELRAKTLAVLREATREMGEVDIALSRPAPKAEFVRDVLRSVADELINYHRQLEENK